MLFSFDTLVLSSDTFESVNFNYSNLHQNVLQKNTNLWLNRGYYSPFYSLIYHFPVLTWQFLTRQLKINLEFQFPQIYIRVLLILNIIFNAVIYYEHLPYKKNETVIVYCNGIYHINVKINEDSRIIVAVLSFKAPRNYK